jgi:hypothetical protein
MKAYWGSGGIAPHIGIRIKLISRQNGIMYFCLVSYTVNLYALILCA